MNIFIDTNIIIDLLADRKPFSKYAIGLFKLSRQNKLKLYTSSHSIATTHYLVKKFVEDNLLRDSISRLFEFMTIIPVDVNILKKSLRSDIRDFEDAIQVMACLSEGSVECIVTRNVKDFKSSTIPVYAPDVILKLLS